MRKFIGFAITSVLLFGSIQISMAVENGKDATGSPYVVPITIDRGSGKFGGCSGALVAPSIVATAGHCVLDVDGLLTKKIYVGDPGSSTDSVSASDIVSSVQITSGYKAGSNNTVAADDIVFLVLSKPKKFEAPIRLASEAEVQALKSKSSILRIYGYGYSSDSGEIAKYPLYTEGTFSSQLVSNQPDSAILKPISQNTCKGDSGGPVLSISATEVLVIGVVTGSDLRNNCGTTFSSFTLISRYSNLAFAAAVTQMTNLDAQVKKAIEDSNQGLRSAESTFNAKYDALQRASQTQQNTDQKNIDELNARIEELEAQVTNLQDQLPKTITCLKGKTIKKVTGVKPKCPVGYILKG
jgi:V8-like Glu-specific endopeptidase/flavin-binding protein dodecin